jgi:uncharacterized membrane protein YkoI
MVYSCGVQRKSAISGFMSNALRSLLLTVMLVATVPSAFADAWQPVAAKDAATILAQRDDRDGRRGWRNRDQGDEQVIPLDTVINGLMAQYPGKPLDARGPMRRGNQLIYEIVWLTQEGRQIVVIVDARSGQVLRVRGLG